MQDTFKMQFHVRILVSMSYPNFVPNRILKFKGLFFVAHFTNKKIIAITDNNFAFLANEFGFQFNIVGEDSSSFFNNG